MNKLFFHIVVALFFMSFQKSKAQRSSKQNQRMEWWHNARFGIFINWGKSTQFIHLPNHKDNGIATVIDVKVGGAIDR